MDLLGTVLYLSRYILGVVGFCLLSWYLSVILSYSCLIWLLGTCTIEVYIPKVGTM